MLQLCNTSFNLSRPAYGQNTSFGITAPASTVYTAIPASVQPVSATVQMFYAQRQIAVDYLVFTDQLLTADIQRGDILVTTDGFNLSITGWRDLAGRNRVLEIACVTYKA